MKKFGFVVMIGGLALSLLLTGGGAYANPGAADCTITGTATLPVFPNTGAPIAGGFTGIAGACAGTAVTVGVPTAAYTYNEPSCNEGNASGTVSIGGASTQFDWTRLGNTALISLSNATATDVQGGALTGGTGVGVGVFVPIPSDPVGTATACAADVPGPGITAVVGANAAIVWL